MIKVMFICHGNICRSPMAQSIFTHLLKQQKLESNFIIDSSATSREETNNPPHIRTKKILEKNNIRLINHFSKRITKNEAKDFDYLICMDNNNIKNLKSIIEKCEYPKVSLLLSYANINRDIRDPWYTNYFGATFDDIYLGCAALLNNLTKK